MRNHALFLSFCAAAALAFRPPGAHGADLGSVGARLLELSPDRIHAFQRTLSELGGQLTLEEAWAAGLQFEARYDAPAGPVAGPFSGPGDVTDVALPAPAWGRDPVAEEQFLLQGREEDFEDAARDWIARQLKGSDAAAAARGNRLAPKFAWDDGPVVGVRKGPISATLGEHEWGVRYSRPLRRWPDWVARVQVGSEDGEEKVAFTIGRSLYRALRR